MKKFLLSFRCKPKNFCGGMNLFNVFALSHYICSLCAINTAKSKSRPFFLNHSLHRGQGVTTLLPFTLPFCTFYLPLVSCLLFQISQKNLLYTPLFHLSWLPHVASCTVAFHRIVYSGSDWFVVMFFAGIALFRYFRFTCTGFVNSQQCLMQDTSVVDSCSHV